MNACSRFSQSAIPNVHTGYGPFTKKVCFSRKARSWQSSIYRSMITVLKLCSTHQLKQQLAEYTSCFALARSPLLSHSCSSGGGPRLPRYFRVGLRGRATHSLPPPPPPPPAFPVPKKTYGFCGRKATCLLAYCTY